jgi:hypothetical protein
MLMISWNQNTPVADCVASLAGLYYGSLVPF